MSIHEKIKEEIEHAIPKIGVKISGNQKTCILYLSGELPGKNKEYADRRKTEVIKLVSAVSKKLNVSIGVVWQVEDRSTQTKQHPVHTTDVAHAEPIHKIKIETFIRKQSPCHVDDISIPECPNPTVKKLVADLIKNEVIGTTKSGLLFVRLSALANGITKRQGLDRLLDKNGRKEV